jgi:hypothetical protein
VRIFPEDKSMPRGFLSYFAVLSSVVWLAAWAAKSPAADSEDVKFETSDRVEIKGTFYPGKKTEPCVLILPKFGSSYKDDDWDQLAVALHKEGFAVLMFDYRGHGDSTEIKNPTAFWSERHNQEGIKGFNPSKLKDKIGYKDFSKAYLPHLADDIAAARLFLDRKNDAGQCNSRSIIVIGAEDGAVLGSMWAYSEYYRFRVKQGAVGAKLPDPEGVDVMGCVWLSMVNNLGGSPGGSATLSWLMDTAKTHDVPMAFMYGAKDATAEKFAKLALDDIKPAKGNEVTVKRPVKETNLKGAKLLDKELGTQSDIITYIKAVKEKKGMADWDTKDSKKNGYIWAFKSLVQPLRAKQEDDDFLSPLPTRVLQSP